MGRTDKRGGIGKDHTYAAKNLKQRMKGSIAWETELELRQNFLSDQHTFKSMMGKVKLPDVVPGNNKSFDVRMLKKNKLSMEFETISFTNGKIQEIIATSNKVDNDSTITVNEEKIPVTKSILAATCEYFRTRLKPNFQDCKNDNLDMELNVSAAVFKQVLDYLQTGKIELSSSNLPKVTTTASFLFLEDLMKFCLDVFKQNIDCESVDFVHTFADDNFFTNLSKAAHNFKIEQFEAVRRSGVFRSWKLEYIQKILRSNLVVVSQEKTVLKFLFQWLLADFEKRGENADELLQNVRYSFLPKKSLDEIAEESKHGQLTTQLFEISRRFSGKETPPRVYTNGIFMLGWNELKNNELKFEKYCPANGTVDILQPPVIDFDAKPTKLREKFHVVVNNGEICAIGYKTGSFQIYDRLRDIWQRRPSLVEQRYGYFRIDGVTACSFQNEIFAFFRYQSDKERFDISKSYAAVYSVTTNAWRYILVNAYQRSIVSSTTCGDSIYLVAVEEDYDRSTLIQYTPSTAVCNVIYCPIPDLADYVVVARNSKLWFTQGSRISNMYAPPNRMIVFCTQTKEFKECAYNSRTHRTLFTLFNQSLHIVQRQKHKKDFLKVEKIDPVSMEDPVSYPLPDWKSDIKVKVGSNVQIISLELD